jgi:hypothetical protein
MGVKSGCGDVVKVLWQPFFHRGRRDGVRELTVRWKVRGRYRDYSYLFNTI